jgi:hypothetical protein
VAAAEAVPKVAPRPTAIPTRKVVRGAATRSTSCAESRARSSTVRTVLSSILISLVPSSADKVVNHCLSSMGFGAPRRRLLCGPHLMLWARMMSWDA